MKYTVLMLGFLLLSGNAQAVCSGGFDGADATFLGCAEMGALGNLIYKRDDSGRVLGKRNETEIKQYLTSIVEDRLKSRGITMKNKEGQTSIVIDNENITFDLFNQNGDKVYTYTVDMEEGVPSNEKDLISSRNAHDAGLIAVKSERKERLARIQALADKIKAEEIDKKAAAK